MHVEQNGIEVKGWGAIQLAINYGWLTDSNIAAANTVTGLRDAVTNASARQDEALQKPDIDKAIVALAAIGVLTDALIAPLTSKAELLALATAGNRIGWQDTYQG